MPTACDVIVVGAGIGGIAAVHRFAQQGLSVVGIEGAPGVGGVWYHNHYPGARVDLEGIYYSYFDPDLYREWTWRERYPSQPALLAYLNFAADRWDVKKHFRFGTWVVDAAFDEATNAYTVTTDTGDTIVGRFLVMATGPLSAARVPDFPGLADFRGDQVVTAHWPDHPVEVAGRRVGVVGTSATGVQIIPLLAEDAAHLYVFQRTANYSVPAQNGPADPDRHATHVSRIEQLTKQCLEHPGGTDLPLGVGPAGGMSAEARTALLEERWAYGGHAMQTVFTDQGIDTVSNEMVGDFVRAKIRDVVSDPDLAERLTPRSYPIGTRRLCVDTNYYQTFNRDNVTLVDIRSDPIDRFTAGGLRTRSGVEYPLDLVVFATGFRPFTGSLFAANIHDGDVGLADLWDRGPRTFLGLQIRGLPNLFLINGPGSPSVLANFFPTSVQQADFIGDLITHMDAHGHARVEPTAAAQEEWTSHVAEVSAPLLRYKTPNYMVHVNEDDGSRVFIPYPGGFDRHARRCAEEAGDGYAGFDFSA